jgi:hypothetical protein
MAVAASSKFRYSPRGKVLKEVDDLLHNDVKNDPEERWRRWRAAAEQLRGLLATEPNSASSWQLLALAYSRLHSIDRMPIKRWLGGWAGASERAVQLTARRSCDALRLLALARQQQEQGADAHEAGFEKLVRECHALCGHMEGCSLEQLNVEAGAPAWGGYGGGLTHNGVGQKPRVDRAASSSEAGEIGRTEKPRKGSTRFVAIGGHELQL